MPKQSRYCLTTHTYLAVFALIPGLTLAAVAVDGVGAPSAVAAPVWKQLVHKQLQLLLGLSTRGPFFGWRAQQLPLPLVRCRRRDHGNVLGRKRAHNAHASFGCRPASLRGAAAAVVLKGRNRVQRGTLVAVLLGEVRVQLRPLGRAKRAAVHNDLGHLRVRLRAHNARLTASHGEPAVRPHRSKGGVQDEWDEWDEWDEVDMLCLGAF